MNLLFTVVLLSSTALVSTLQIQEYDSSFKIDANGYIEALTAETLKGIAKNPDPGTQQLTEYGSIIQDTPYSLVLGRISVTGLNFSASDIANESYKNAPAISVNYTFNQALVRTHTMLSLRTDASNITHGYAMLQLSGLTDKVLVVASRRFDGSYRAELVSNDLTTAGTLENINITKGSASDNMKRYVAEVYGVDTVAISKEVTLVFKMYLENSLRRVDLSKYVTEM